MPPYGAADFNNQLKSLMVSFGTTQSGKQDALTNVQQDIENVRGIMTDNIERVLERGERIDLLVDKTDRLGVGAHDFRVRSRGLKRRMWWKNVKLMALLTVVIIFLIYLFVGFGCGLPGEFSPFDNVSGMGGWSADFATSMVSMCEMRVTCLGFGLESFERGQEDLYSFCGDSLSHVFIVAFSNEIGLHVPEQPRFSLSTVK